jgi:RimJ/RimL family protein N-acetyltransferase
MQPILSVVCEEPKGSVQRAIYPMQLDQTNLLMFWEKSKKYPTIFGKEACQDFKEFLSLFVGEDKNGLVSKGLLWRIDGPNEPMVGVFYMTDIQPGNDALVHFTFFDGRIKGRDVLAKQMLKYVVSKYGFHRLTAQCPMFVVPAALHFIERIGFKKEGRKRKSSFFNGEWFDTIHFGILAEEC